jgi:hypothetical protein
LTTESSGKLKFFENCFEPISAGFLTSEYSVYILGLTVFKRLVSISLALIFAVQLLAGICICLDDKENSHAKTSCCKSKNPDQTSVSNLMDCCKQACGKPTGNIPGSTNTTSVQISAPILTAVENLIASLKPKPDFPSAILLSKRAGDLAQLSIKPPELYLQNHAFLI